MNRKLSTLTKSALVAASLSGLMLTSCSKDDAEVIVNKVEEHSELTSQVQVNTITNFIKLSGESHFVLAPGETAQITEGESFDKIYSLDPKVATVDASGKITAVSNGFTKVIVAAGNQVLKEYTVCSGKDGLLFWGDKIITLESWYEDQDREDGNKQLYLYFDEPGDNCNGLDLVYSSAEMISLKEAYFFSYYTKPISISDCELYIQKNADGVPVVTFVGIADKKPLILIFTLSEDTND